MTNWYCPVSFIEIDVSLACVVVTTVACRGSFFGVLQRVRQKRPPPEAEWLLRERPGICSQHSEVLHARPAPTIESSPPCSRTWTEPPPAPCGFGFGPQASPQSPMTHFSVSAVALQ